MELLLDVLSHLWCCRRREGKDGDVGFQRPYIGDMEIRRPEVIAPLADAVGLVDGDEADLHVAELRQEELRRESFGRDVEKLTPTEDGVLQRLNDIAAAHPRMDGGGSDASVAEMLHLVFHQGDEGCDDDACTLHRHRRYLERDTLSTARRHQSECIMTASYTLDDLPLDTPEVGISPVLLKNLTIIQLKIKKVKK